VPWVCLQAAIRDPDPVCILENELLYGQTFAVPEAALDPDFLLPIGKAKVMREGTDVTLVAFSKMVRAPLLLSTHQLPSPNGTLFLSACWPDGKGNAPII
jgi:pyruvate/2-oxoglutarate/acetoin dehydrogenase E1 component